ncbi:hypothetical protein JHK85_019145 [Glycine max]|uniref:Uncharacterized protein n=1 Tax=Glycine soja TaxID=3848 RepID=A0A0B2NUI2_GLYSO|nr:hypothetical protein JHK85_019145 [Glycine max]KHM98897.1 hypothetical protein glysoja_039067 [Glycine soja]
MESELKDLNSKPPNYNDNANSVFDDHLLLKLEPPASADSIAEMEKKYAAVMCTTPWDATSFRKRRSSSSAFHWICTLFSASTGEEEQKDYAHILRMSLLNAFAIDSDAGGIEKNNNIKAIDLLQKNQDNAKASLQVLAADIHFLRDQVTLTQV